MRKRRIFAAVIAALMLSGCSVLEDLPSEADDSAEAVISTEEDLFSDTSEKTSLSYGTGLEEITITAQQDPDPDRQIVHRRTPVRQISGIDVNGNSLSNDFYFYRNLLSGTYKQAYDQIYSALYNGSQTVNMSVSVQSADIVDIVYSVYYDHPELFWVDSSFTYYMNGSGISRIILNLPTITDISTTGAMRTGIQMMIVMIIMTIVMITMIIAGKGQNTVCSCR
ncbi:MAG: hypothetical protein J6A19_07605 [Oscillospiraceae bacterium]|nr:hypothetical protein [Oscillospiraceae bacterium]